MGSRRMVTSRFRTTDIFTRRVVITISRSGVITIALSIFLGLTWTNKGATLSTVAVACTIIALAVIVEARHQLRCFRYELREKINEILATYQIPDDDLREAFALQMLEDDDAPSVHLRLPRHR